MKHLFYLSTCRTCLRIIRETKIGDYDFVREAIKQALQTYTPT